MQIFVSGVVGTGAAAVAGAGVGWLSEQTWWGRSQFGQEHPYLMPAGQIVICHVGKRLFGRHLNVRDAFMGAAGVSGEQWRRAYAAVKPGVVGGEAQGPGGMVAAALDNVRRKVRAA